MGRFSLPFRKIPLSLPRGYVVFAPLIIKQNKCKAKNTLILLRFVATDQIFPEQCAMPSGQNFLNEGFEITLRHTR